MTEQHENLARLCRLIAEKCDGLPPYDYREDAAVRLHRDAVTALASELATAEGAAIRESGSAMSVRLAGIRATSTMGLLGALSNWRAAAQKRIGGAA